VPDKPELHAVIRGAIVLVSARLMNIPPGALVEPERIAKLKQDKEVLVCSGVASCRRCWLVIVHPFSLRLPSVAGRFSMTLGTSCRRGCWTILLTSTQTICLLMLWGCDMRRAGFKLCCRD
jgi:hypothetical protein